MKIDPIHQNVDFANRCRTDPVPSCYIQHMGLFRPTEPKIIRLSDANPQALDFLCWRVTRAIALAKGILGPEETLLDLYRRDPEALTQTESQSYPDSPVEIACQDIPSVPTPETVRGFCLAATRVVDFIRENIGEIEAAIVTSPLTAEQAWPSQNEMMALEHRMVQDGYEMLTGEVPRGRFVLHRRLSEKMSYMEADGILRMVYNLIATVSLADMEQERAMLIARFDNLATRAAEQNNLTAETNALRSLAVLLGVSKSEPINEMKEISSVIENYSKLVPNTSGGRRALPRGDDDGV